VVLLSARHVADVRTDSGGAEMLSIETDNAADGCSSGGRRRLKEMQD
jgi:hypothetical protein